MKIRWGFDTGYVTRIPDFFIEVPDEDLEDLSPEEQDRVIDEYVNDEFSNRVMPWWKREDA